MRVRRRQERSISGGEILFPGASREQDMGLGFAFMPDSSLVPRQHRTAGGCFGLLGFVLLNKPIGAAAVLPRVMEKFVLSPR